MQDNTTPADAPAVTPDVTPVVTETPVVTTPVVPVEVVTPIDAVPTVESLSGFADGSVLKTGEKITGDFDDDGNLVGWSKEAPVEATV